MAGHWVGGLDVIRCRMVRLWGGEATFTGRCWTIYYEHDGNEAHEIPLYIWREQAICILDTTDYCFRISGDGTRTNSRHLQSEHVWVLRRTLAYNIYNTTLIWVVSKDHGSVLKSALST